MKPSPEIRDTILCLYESMSTGDTETIERLFARQSGIQAIGSEPQEWWGDYETIVQTFKAQSAGRGGKKIQEGGIKAFEEGTVGWAAEQRTIRLKTGKEWTVRETFVLHREEGEWKFVQFHASLGVPGVEMGS